MLNHLTLIVALFPACFETAYNKGWWDAEFDHESGKPDPARVWAVVPEKLALVHSELSEALEDLRVGKVETTTNEKGKPGGAVSELADVAIRLGDLCGAMGLVLHVGDVDDREVEVTCRIFERPSDRLAFVHEKASSILGMWRMCHYYDPEVIAATQAREAMATRIVTVLLYLDRMASDLGGDLVAEMERKMAYNLTRPYRHGGKGF